MPALLDGRRRSADAASRRFDAALGGSGGADLAPAALLGVENEYTLSRAGEPLDFRRLIHTLPIDGRRLDPGDVNAYRTASGLALTCDDAEAEVASPPVRLAPGFTADLSAWAQGGERLLHDILPSGVALDGFSTHVSAALPPHLVEPVARLYARTYAPALMLLAEKRDSYGIYVRPRPGRLELCTDHVPNDRLRAVAAFVAGSVRACAAALSSATPLPPLNVTLLPSPERYGLYVGRLAFGGNLYAAGRSSVLSRLDGTTVSAQTQLEDAWTLARRAIARETDAADLDLVDRLVAGDLPLALEDGGAPLPLPPSTRSPVSPEGDALRLRSRPAFAATAVLATWDFTIFELRGRRRAYACIPRPHLATFLAELDAGRLDATIDAYLQRPDAGRTLQRRRQTQRPALWDRLGRAADLLPRERPPATGNGAGASQPRQTKRGRMAPFAGLVWWQRYPAVVIVALILLLGAAYALLAGGDDLDPLQGVAVAVVTPEPSVATPLPQIQPTIRPDQTLGPPAGATQPSPTPAPTTQPTAAPTQPPPTATPPPAVNQTLGAGPIVALFQAPTTVYTVQNTRPGLTFTWSGPDCGTITNPTPASLTWSHPHPPCDPTTEHADVQVAVVISDGTNRLRCVYQGALQGVGPACAALP